MSKAFAAATSINARSEHNLDQRGRGRRAPVATELARVAAGAETRPRTATRATNAKPNMQQLPLTPNWLNHRRCLPSPAAAISNARLLARLLARLASGNGPDLGRHKRRPDDDGWHGRYESSEPSQTRRPAVNDRILTSTFGRQNLVTVAHRPCAPPNLNPKNRSPRRRRRR